MYLPSHFNESRPEVLHDLIHREPLGLLVTLGPGGLTANPIPFELAPGEGPHGVLRAHVARANPVWKDTQFDVPALVVFQGPSAYISPTLYPTKAETHKVVPTYNYVIVQARGRIIVKDDPVWLRAQVGRLTQRFEGGREAPWSVSDAPGDYIDAMLAAIVGIEIPLTELTGKWKVSQNRPLQDRESVAKAFAGHPMGDLVAERVKEIPKRA